MVIRRGIPIYSLENIKSARLQSSIRIGNIVPEVKVEVDFFIAHDRLSFLSESDTIRRAFLDPKCNMLVFYL